MIRYCVARDGQYPATATRVGLWDRQYIVLAAVGPHMRFELMDAWRGWRHATTPDNCKVTFHLDGESRRVDASLELLLELYGHVRHESPCHLIGGSGTALEIEDRPTGVRFQLNYSIGTDTTYDQLEWELESLLGEVFDMHDRLGPDRRDEELADIQQYVERRGVDYDVRACYERLA